MRGPEPGLIRTRSIVLGCLLMPANAYWVIQMEKVLPGPYPTTISLFANVVFVLALLVGANGVLLRRRPGWALSQAELLVTYTMVAIGSALAGHDFIPVLIQMMPHAWWFATPENRWMEMFGQYLPHWLSVSDKTALIGFYSGGESIYQADILRAWAVPVACWSAFVLALGMVMLAMSILSRNLWIERERLTYPIVELPVQMTRPGTDLWRNRLLWLGFAIAGSIDIINGLNFLYPNIPCILVKQNDMIRYITDKPWNAVGWFPISFYPFAIGLGYLLPVDLLFSCWFFYLFFKGQQVFASAQGWDAIPMFPFIREQGYGAYMAIFLLLVWNGRKYLVQVVRRACGMRSDLDDSSEGLSYRTCLLILTAGFAFLVWFLVEAGLSLGLSLACVALYFAFSLVITRIRAELGPPVHDQHFSGPDAFIVQGAGSAHFSAQDLTAINWLGWFNRAYRSHPMPILAEGLRASGQAKSSDKRFTKAMIVAWVFGTFFAFWASLDCFYAYGAAAKMRQGFWFGWEYFNRLSGWIATPTQPNMPANYAILAGFASALLLGIIRSQFHGFVLHPIGFAISGSWSMNLVWLPLFIAWVLKATILRYGGLRMYRTFLPFFLGLILGQYIVGSLWSLLGLILGIPTYSFWGA